jgi:hypothetical protein
VDDAAAGGHPLAIAAAIAAAVSPAGGVCVRGVCCVCACARVSARVCDVGGGDGGNGSLL